MGRFLVGAVLREVRNGRLNCNNPKNEEFKKGDDNATYVKKIRKGREVFPYASGQWQKKNIKNFAELKGNTVSPVMSISSKEAVTEGDPLVNYDEDVMGFMIAKNLELTKEEYDKLPEEEQKDFKHSKGIYKKNITKKRRTNLMLSPLQAIGTVRITEEFSVKETDGTPLPYVKEVYSSDMAGGFILDIEKVGAFQASDNETGFRDYHLAEVEQANIDDNGMFFLDKDAKLKRILDTIDGIHFMNTNITMCNNLENLSAKFIILTEYNIGSAVFNNIFGEGQLKIQYLREEIGKMEEYRLSKIYIGCNSECFRQEDRYLKDTLEYEFDGDDRIIIDTVSSAIEKYKTHLESTL